MTPISSSRGTLQAEHGADGPVPPAEQFPHSGNESGGSERCS